MSGRKFRSQVWDGQYTDLFQELQRLERTRVVIPPLIIYWGESLNNILYRLYDVYLDKDLYPKG